MSADTVQLIIMLSSIVTPLVLLAGIVKLIFVLGEFTPHRHTEHEGHLTTDGIIYPLGMTNGR